eukprot:TRINITY_DN1537_c0_g1_i4.p1 TRINITY_DN1537_c0_g1~~TRINITY_DN1537_c0_g1_i4.p1  ORF type:complete len:1047 (-),score=204.25 TRINITY_DN1537_c0_g1_i4:452-3379(-)
MDTVSTYNTQQKIYFISNYTIKLIKTWKPAVVIFAGDRVFQSVVLPYQQMRLKDPNSLPEIPFVFCGVNLDLVDIYNKAGPNIISDSNFKGSVSGVAIQEPFQKKIDLALKFHPNASKIAFVFDNSLLSQIQSTTLKNMINSSQINTYGLPIEVVQIISFSNFTQIMTTLQNNNYGIIVMNLFRLFTDNTQTVTVAPNVITDWVQNNVALHVLGPVYQGFSVDIRLDPNITCSYAGVMASKIILQNSKKISDPIVTKIEDYFIETDIYRPRFNDLKKISPQIKSFLEDTNQVPNMNIYTPLFYVNPIKLMIVHSYSEDYDWPVSQQKGFMASMENQGIPRSSYYLRVFWMDTKQTFNTPELLDYVAASALQDLNYYRPDVLYVTDDDAFRFVEIPYLNSTINTTWSCKYVFSGINSDPKVFPIVESPQSNITGILEVTDFSALISASLSISSKIKSLTFLYDGTSVSDTLKKKVDALIIQKGSSWPKSRSFQFTNYTDFKKFILNDKTSSDPSDLLVYGGYAGFKNDDGSGVPGGEVIQWANSHRNGTEVSQSTTFAYDGGLMALGQDPTDAGNAAGMYAAAMVNGTSFTNLPITGNVSSSLSFNRQRILFTSANIPSQILIGSRVYESTINAATNDLIASNSEMTVGYLVFVLFLILGILSACLLQFVVLFWPKGSNVVSAKYRSAFYTCLIILSIMRLFQIMIELNVKPPATNLIGEFVFYKLGSIFYIGSMMIECLLWINIIKASLDTNFFVNTMRVYCITLCILNTVAQIVSIAVFSAYASEAVALNHNKIVAYNQGLYVSKYGSIKEEIVNTYPELNAAARASQLVTGVIGVLHALIFFIVGIFFLRTVLSSSEKTQNKSKRRKYIALKIIILTAIIGICSTASLVYFIILAKGSTWGTQKWVALLFDLIIFEWIPCFALLATYIYSAKSSLGSKKTHIKLKDKEVPLSTSSSSKSSVKSGNSTSMKSFN